MNSDGVRKPLGEVVSLQRGHDLPIQNRVLGSVPIMSSAGITGWHNEAKMKAPGIVVGRSGNSMGEVHYCDADYWPLNTCLFVTNFKDNDERFIYLLLQSVNFEQFNSGSAQQSLNRNAVYPYEVTLPESKEEQAKIANVIFDITDKIRLNYQTNQTLEAIAQAIFKSWFVDFEPVKAKIAAFEAGENAEDITRATMSAISGKTDEELDQLKAEQLEHYTQLKNTAELFPSSMQDSELGEIPLGWMVRTLGSLLTELRRGISPKYIDEGGIIVINQKCIRNHSVNFSLARRNDTKLQKIEGREIQVGDVLVNSTGVGTLGRLATIRYRYLPEPAVVDSHITVVRASDEISPLFLNEYMLTKESFIEASGAGSTGQTELRRQVLEELFIVVPNHTLIDSFETMSKPISSSIAEREQECQLLTQIRDTLLPKLLSGELSVDAAKLAEE